MATVQLCITVPMGSLVPLTASFKRAPTQAEIDAGADPDNTNTWPPIDPDTVTAKVMDPNGVVIVHDYLSSPGADIVRDDVGEYHLNITPDVAGEWVYGFISTGIGQAEREGFFRVSARRIP